MGGTIDAAAYPEYAPAPDYIATTNQNLALKTLQDLLAAHGTLDHIRLCNKDSKLIDDADLTALEHAVIANQENYDRIIITIGTDRMTAIAATLEKNLGEPPDCPVVFTGAIWPLANGEKSDGRENLHLAAFHDPLALPGVYVAMHGLFLPCTRILKDTEKKRFVRLA